MYSMHKMFRRVKCGCVYSVDFYLICQFYKEDIKCVQSCQTCTDEDKNNTIDELFNNELKEDNTVKWYR